MVPPSVPQWFQPLHVAMSAALDDKGSMETESPTLSRASPISLHHCPFSTWSGCPVITSTNERLKKQRAPSPFSFSDSNPSLIMGKVTVHDRALVQEASIPHCHSGQDSCFKAFVCV